MKIFSPSVTDQIYQKLLDSTARSGPFDGGCLILAKAMRLAYGRGELAYIGSSVNEAEHFGLFIDGWFLDMDGPAETAEEWISRFSKNENCHRDGMFVGFGLPDTLIPQDPSSEKAIASLIASESNALLSDCCE